MLSLQLLRLIVDQREQEIQADLRARRLLRRPRDGGPDADGPSARYRDSWRVRTPRASATTR